MSSPNYRKNMSEYRKIMKRSKRNHRHHTQSESTHITSEEDGWVITVGWKMGRRLRHLYVVKSGQTITIVLKANLRSILGGGAVSDLFWVAGKAAGSITRAWMFGGRSPQEGWAITTKWKVSW